MRVEALSGAELGGALAAALAAILALFVLSIWLLVRVQHLSRAYARLMAGSRGESLEEVLNAHLDRVVTAVARADEVAAACRDLDRRLTGCVQHVGVLRFDAFGDVGGQLSFALALLDDNGTGMVMSSLHSRQETRLFVKPMRDGKSEVPLTAEEVEALRQAGCEATASRLVRADR